MPIIGGGSTAKPTSLTGPGTYVIELVEVKVVKKPRGQFAKPELGQNAEDLIDKLLWLFLEESSAEQIDVLTSTSTAENSTFFTQIGPALNAGVPPCAPNESFNTDELIGRSCLGAIQINKGGYAKVTSFTALPRQGSAKPSNDSATETIPF